jgi:ABC-type phosphate transport system substrate-binding protein
MKLLKSKRSLATIGGLALSVMLIAPVVAQSPVVLVNEGSTTVLPISEAIETDFETKYPGIDLQIAGGGSGHGVKSVSNYYGNETSWPDHQGVEVGNASRFDKSSDYTSNTFAQSDMQDNLIGLDAVCVIVPDPNPGVSGDPLDFMTTIHVDELKYIYEYGANINSLTYQMVDLQADSNNDGDNNDWSDSLDNVGVVPRARIIGSGTRDCFCSCSGIDDDVLEPATISATGLGRLDGNSQMVTAIATATDGSIGYCGFGYLGDSSANHRPVDVASDTSGGAVTPSQATVYDESYPLWRYLHMYTVKNGLGGTAYESKRTEIDTYINYVLGVLGQAFVQNEGFFKIESLEAAPDWDVNGDRNCNVADIVGVGSHWNETPPTSPNTGKLIKHWTRANVNGDSAGVNVADIVGVGNAWGSTW